MSYDVSITRCNTYDDEQVRTAVAAALAPLGGMAAFVQPEQQVLLKLNLLSGHAPEDAVTTHPAIVKAVVQMVQECGATAIVGDSPGGVLSDAQYHELLEITGIRQVIDETGCAWVNFDASTAEYASEQARVFKRFTMATALWEADVIIGLPKLKTHQFMFYTGAVKLLYGYLPGVTKAEYHLHAGRSRDTFADLLLDIHDTLPPALTIMDAVVGMEGNGPTHGTPREVGVIIAGRSCTALDFLMTHLIGMDPLSVPTVQAAVRRGSGPACLQQITVYGEDPAAVRIPDFQPAGTTGGWGMPAWLANCSTWLFSAWPEIDAAPCKRCGRCKEHCPPQTITMPDGSPPHIELAACLRCYCCHELCPHDAVRIAGPRVSFPRELVSRLYGRHTRKEARERRNSDK